MDSKSLQLLIIHIVLLSSISLSVYSASVFSDLPAENANISTLWTNNSVDLKSFAPTRNTLIRFVMFNNRTSALDKPGIGCGFFRKGTRNRFYFIIFFYDVVGNNNYPRVLWTANRKHFVQDNATLEFTSMGDLVLKDVDGTLVWSTSTSSKSVSGMKVMETGNLILHNASDAIIWQSFDYPTDSWFPGQRMEDGQRLAASTSDWEPSPGPLYIEFQTNALYAFSGSNPSKHYAEVSLVDSKSFSSVKIDVLGDTRNPSFMFSSVDTRSKVQFIRFDNDGHLRVYKFINGMMEEAEDIFSHTGRRNDSFKKVLIASFLGFSLLSIMIALAFVLFRMHNKHVKVSSRGALSQKGEDSLDQEYGSPRRFSFTDLEFATGNFNRRLGGGGFGSVFEGNFGDGTKIAVKRLDQLGQGRKEFLAEVKTIGSIHHVNLVRLIGFCAEKSHKLLVYEYMSNGSLEKWIFQQNQERTLDWQTRRHVIHGIAKGLSYLHEECQKRIVHLDIKPQNILIDGKFTAKVSDFGLARFIDRDQSQVVTTMRGTRGYLAPEWFLNRRISEKADVYSFGVVVLEIICGRKSLDHSQQEENECLLHLVKKKAEEAQLFDVIDEQSEDMKKNREEVVRMITVAIWCLQRDSGKRPSMSMVVRVLEGVTDIDDISDSDLSFLTMAPLELHREINVSSSSPLSALTLSGPR